MNTPSKPNDSLSDSAGLATAWPGPRSSRPGPGQEPEIVTMCSHCRQLKNDAGEWVDPSALAELLDEDNISHGICPPCIRANYPPALADRVLSRQRDETLGKE